MELKTLTFKISCINRIFDMDAHCDDANLHLNGTLQSSADDLNDEGAGPIHIEYYGKTYNIAGLHVLVSVQKRPPRSEVQGIPCEEPWRSNNDPRDTIRIDGLNEDYMFVNLSVFLPPEIWNRLYNADLNTCNVCINAHFLNTGENPLKVDEPSSFLFAYLSRLSVQILSIKVEKDDVQEE